MASYRYTVVVDVEVGTGGTARGVEQHETYLRKIEREAIESSRRIRDEEAKTAREIYHDKVQSYNQQVEASRRLAREEIELEREKNQQIANERRRARIERFNQQRQEFDALQQQNRQRQQAFAEDNARFEALFRRTLMRSHGLTATPDEIRARTGFERTRNQGVLDFATRESAAGLRDIDRIVSGQRIKDADRQLEQLTRTTRRSADGLGMWGQAFKGAFIGAIAGMAFRTVVELPIAIGRIGIAAVQTGARLETTTNALRVFAGSTTRATRELAEIDAVARNTAGLRLETAEVGFTRLRALGFEAEQAKSFIKELGEEKILSGASDEALERIIFNFSQIASGGQKVSQELREILTQMPSMRKAFFEAFETLDPKKIQSIFDADTDAAFKKLTDAMARQKAATGGLEDAWGKFEDSFIEAGRELSKPIIPELTKDLQALTQEIRNSADDIKTWGEIIKTVYVESRPFFKGYEAVTADIRQRLGITGYFERRAMERNKAIMASKLAQSPDLFRPDNTIDLSVLTRTPKTAEEIETDRQNQLQKEQIQLEKNRQSILENTKTWYEEQSEASRNFYDVEEAKLKKNLDLTLEEQLKTSKAVGALREKAIQKEIQLTKEYYDYVIKDAEGDRELTVKLESERNQKLGKLNRDLQIQEIENQKEIQQKEREILLKRREDYLEFTNLQIREINSYYDKVTFEIERGIENETVSVKKGYDDMAKLTEDNFNYISAITKRQFEVRLKDESLSAQERINIEKEMFLTLEDLAFETYQKLLELNEKRFDETARKLREETDFIKETLNARKTLFSSLRGILEPSLTFGQGVGALNLIRAFGGGAKGFLDNIQGVIAGQKRFFDAQSELLENIHKTERDNLAAEIQLNKDLLHIERLRGIENEKIFIQNLNTRRENALLLKERATQGGRPEEAEQYERIASGLNDLIKERQGYLAQITADETKVVTAGTKQLENKGKILDSEQKQLAINQDIEKSNLRQQTDVKKLREDYEAIAAGQKDNLIFQLSELDILNRRNEAVAQYRKVLVDGQSEYLLNLERETHIIEYLTELRNREIEAIYRKDRAQIDIANHLVFSQNRADADFLEFLASQKGVTEIFSETRINAISAAYQGLDSVIGRLTQRFGVFGDVIKDLISNLLKLALNNIFMKLFFGGQGGTQGGGFGGFQTPSIFGGGGGFGGFGTPVFNPNAAIGFGGFAGGGITGAGRTSVIERMFQSAIGGGGNLHEFIAQNASRANTGTFGGTLQSGFQGFMGSPAFAGVFTGGLLGSQLGRGSIGGSLLGGLGGGLLGLSTMAFLGVGSAQSALGSVGSLFGLGLGTSSIALGAFAFGIPAALMLGAFFIGRSARRRKEEKIHNQAMIDALKAMDDLIAKVNNDSIDGESALAQAEQIKAAYLEKMNALTDKKTRQIAIKDGNERLGAKITELKAAIEGQNSRRERLEMSVPTFAGGGSLFDEKYRYNPMGYQRDNESIGYFPKSNRYARYNEEGYEYILDAETTRNIGHHALDTMRHTKGESFNSMRRQMVMPQMQTGGTFTSSGGGGMNTGTGQIIVRPVIEIQVSVGISAEEFVKVASAAIRQNDGSREQITDINTYLRNEGDSNQLVRTITDAVIKRLNG